MREHIRLGWRTGRSRQNTPYAVPYKLDQNAASVLPERFSDGRIRACRAPLLVFRTGNPYRLPTCTANRFAISELGSEFYFVRFHSAQSLLLSPKSFLRVFVPARSEFMLSSAAKWS